MKREKLKEAITEALLGESFFGNPSVGDVLEGSFYLGPSSGDGMEPYEAMLVVKVLNNKEFLGQVVYTKYGCDVPKSGWNSQKQCFKNKPIRCHVDDVDERNESASRAMKKIIKAAGGNVEKAIADNNKVSATHW